MKVSQSTTRLQTEAYEDFIQFEDRGDIGNEYIISNQKEQGQFSQNWKVMKFWKTMLAVLRFCSNMTLTIPVEAQMKNWMLDQRGIIEFMKRDAGRSEESWQPFLLETEMTIFVDDPQVPSRRALPIQPKTTAFVSWSKLITHAQVMILKSIYEVATRPNKPAALLGKIQIHNTNKAFVSLADDVKEGDSS